MHALLKCFVCIYFVLCATTFILVLVFFLCYGVGEIHGMGVIAVLFMVMVVVMLVVISSFFDLVC
jgi:hypothetical protein